MFKKSERDNKDQGDDNEKKEKELSAATRDIPHTLFSSEELN